MLFVFEVVIDVLASGPEVWSKEVFFIAFGGVLKSIGSAYNPTFCIELARSLTRGDSWVSFEYFSRRLARDIKFI